MKLNGVYPQGIRIFAHPGAVGRPANLRRVTRLPEGGRRRLGLAPPHQTGVLKVRHTTLLRLTPLPCVHSRPYLTQLSSVMAARVPCVTMFCPTKRAGVRPPQAPMGVKERGDAWKDKLDSIS